MDPHVKDICGFVPSILKPLYYITVFVGFRSHVSHVVPCDNGYQLQSGIDKTRPAASDFC